MILQAALKSNASGLLVCHNHPSDNLNPSESDTKITHKLRDAGKLMDIQLLNHIIIYDEDYYSFADNGLLKTKAIDRWLFIQSDLLLFKIKIYNHSEN